MKYKLINDMVLRTGKNNIAVQYMYRYFKIIIVVSMK